VSFLHRRQHGFECVDRAEPEILKAGLPLSVRDLGEVALRRPAGVHDQDVQRSPGRQKLIDHRATRAGLGQVAHQAERRADLLGCSLNPRLIAGTDRRLNTLPDQRSGDGAPQPARGPDHQGALSFKAEIHTRSP
jgi:hypothetical protein